MKTEWGFTKFLPLDTFKDVSHGYLVNDCCLFGVEVFVHNHSSKLECVSMTKQPANSTLTWKIENFSALDEESYSQEFTVADSQWYFITRSCTFIVIKRKVNFYVYQHYFLLEHFNIN